MRSEILSPGMYTEQTDQLSTGYDDKQSQFFGYEQQFASDSQQGAGSLFENACNPYAAALADVFGLEA